MVIELSIRIFASTGLKDVLRCKADCVVLAASIAACGCSQCIEPTADGNGETFNTQAAPMKSQSETTQHRHIDSKKADQEATLRDGVGSFSRPTAAEEQIWQEQTAQSLGDARSLDIYTASEFDRRLRDACDHTQLTSRYNGQLGRPTYGQQLSEDDWRSCLTWSLVDPKGLLACSLRISFREEEGTLTAIRLNGHTLYIVLEEELGTLEPDEMTPLLSGISIREFLSRLPDAN